MKRPLPEFAKRFRVLGQSEVSKPSRRWVTWSGVATVAVLAATMVWKATDGFALYRIVGCGADCTDAHVARLDAPNEVRYTTRAPVRDTTAATAQDPVEADSREADNGITSKTKEESQSP